MLVSVWFAVYSTAGTYDISTEPSGTSTWVLLAYSCSPVYSRISLAYFLTDNKITKSKLGTGCVVTLHVRPSYSHPAQSFYHICQVAPMCTAHPTNALFLGPTHSSSQMTDRFSHFSMADAAFSLHITLCHPISPNFSLPWGFGTPSTVISCVHPTHFPNSVSIDLAVFLQYMLITNG